jgi:hypothetical protein
LTRIDQTKEYGQKKIIVSFSGTAACVFTLGKKNCQFLEFFRVRSVSFVLVQMQRQLIPETTMHAFDINALLTMIAINKLTDRTRKNSRN